MMQFIGGGLMGTGLFAISLAISMALEVRACEVVNKSPCGYVLQVIGTHTTRNPTDTP